MDFINAIIGWYQDSPYERALLSLGIANAIVKQTPWKGDDDLVDGIKKVVLSTFRLRE